MKLTEARIKTLAARLAAHGANPEHVFRGTEDGVEHIWIDSDGVPRRVLISEADFNVINSGGK